MNNPFSLRDRFRELHSGRGNGASGFFRDLELSVVERVEFFRVFIKAPTHVGAVSPSSRSLARAMLHELALKTADTVVEIGPGTGAFTDLILKRIGEDTTFIALEVSESYAKSLRRRFPKLAVYHDSAEQMQHYLGHHGKKSAKYIVSGIPWALLDPGIQTRIMNAVVASLEPKGVFTTFAYLHALWMPSARKFRRTLEACFANVKTSPVVWKNLPPAFVYRCSQVRKKPASKR